MKTTTRQTLAIALSLFLALPTSALAAPKRSFGGRSATASSMKSMKSSGGSSSNSSFKKSTANATKQSTSSQNVSRAAALQNSQKTPSLGAATLSNRATSNNSAIAKNKAAFKNKATFNNNGNINQGNLNSNNVAKFNRPNVTTQAGKNNFAKRKQTQITLPDSAKGSSKTLNPAIVRNPALAGGKISLSGKGGQSTSTMGKLRPGAKLDTGKLSTIGKLPTKSIGKVGIGNVGIGQVGSGNLTLPGKGNVAKNKIALPGNLQRGDLAKQLPNLGSKLGNIDAKKGLPELAGKKGSLPKNDSNTLPAIDSSDAPGGTMTTQGFFDDPIGAIGDAAEDFVEDPVGTVTEGAGEIAEAIDEVIETGAEVIGDGIEAGGDVIGEGIETGGELVEEGIETGGEVIREGIDTGGKIADDIRDQFERFDPLNPDARVDDAIDQVDDAVDDAVDAADDYVDDQVNEPPVDQPPVEQPPVDQPPVDQPPVDDDYVGDDYDEDGYDDGYDDGYVDDEYCHDDHHGFPPISIFLPPPVFGGGGGGGFVGGGGGGGFVEVPVPVEVPVAVPFDEPMVDAAIEELPQVPVGATITLSGEQLGDAAGQVLVELGPLVLPAVVVDWQDEAVVVTVPELMLTQAAAATLHIVAADGTVLVSLRVELIPAPAVNNPAAANPAAQPQEAAQ